MCGRFVLKAPALQLRTTFAVEDAFDYPPRFNIAPMQPVGVIVSESGQRRFRLMRWGFMPAWVKDPAQFSLIINARAETAPGKPAFRAAMRHRRCIIPADGFYEWQARGATKQPYFIAPRDGRVMAFAALCETWAGPHGEEVDTVAILTVAASADMRALHERMPAILDPDALDLWLDCARVDALTAQALLQPRASGFLQWHPVSRDVNRTANDGAHLIAAVADIEPPPAQPAKTIKRTRPRASPDQSSLF